MQPARWTPARRRKLQELFDSGYTYTEIAARMSMTYAQIRGCVERSGLFRPRPRPVPGGTPWTEARLGKLVALYERGLSCAERDQLFNRGA